MSATMRKTPYRLTVSLHLFIVAVLSVVGMGQGQPASRGPSTPEERERIVRIAKSLEANPVAPGMAEDREWAREFIDKVPDIGVLLCTKTFSYLRANPDYVYGPALEDLAVVEGARFAIEHPESKDPNAQAIAMVEGTLRGYESLLKDEPRAGNLRIDAMIAKRDGGTLADYMKDACTPTSQGRP